MSTIEELYDEALEEMLRQQQVAITDAVSVTRSDPKVLEYMNNRHAAASPQFVYSQQCKLDAHKLRLYHRVYNLIMSAHGTPVGDFIAEYLQSLELIMCVPVVQEQAKIIGQLAKSLQSDDVDALIASLRDLFSIIVPPLKGEGDWIYQSLMNLVRDEL